MTIKSLLPSYDLSNKRVLLRADLNVPIKNNTLVDDYRLLAIMPTINLIQKKGGTIILATHIGRPHKQGAPKISTKILLPWFKQRGYQIEFMPNLESAYKKSYSKTRKILLLENLRFFPGEKTESVPFAQHLARLGDIYVNDAFALLHRTDTSVVLVPSLFSKDARTIGLLVEKELAMLNPLINSPEQPFVLIIGGGKVASKLPLLKALLHSIKTLLLCPALSSTFAKARGESVGKSLVDETALKMCANLLEKAKMREVKILLPIDYQIALNSLKGPLNYVDAARFPANGLSIAIGPKTIQLYKKEIVGARTIFFNAAMGFFDRPETLESLEDLLKIIASSSAYKVIGGGDSVAAARRFDIDKNINYLSTGGGATLAYLSGKKLPGLMAFE